VSVWNKETIAVEILTLHAAGQPLNYGDVHKNYLRLLRAATRHFGSWKSAIEYAGLNYEDVRRYRTWTRDRIVDRIAEHRDAGQDLSWRHVSTKLDPSLAAAAVRPNRFGSWRSALEAAGLDYEEVRKHKAWDAPSILAELRRMHAAGESLRVSDVTERRPALVAAARRWFDGWYEAVIAAGLDEWEARRGLRDDLDEEMIQGETDWQRVAAE
jgi:hypothetical protein